MKIDPEDVKKVVEGFDKGHFVRSVAKDVRSDWAVIILPYLAALGRLARAVEGERPDGEKCAAKAAACLRAERNRLRVLVALQREVIQVYRDECEVGGRHPHLIERLDRLLSDSTCPAAVDWARAEGRALAVADAEGSSWLDRALALAAEPWKALAARQLSLLENTIDVSAPCLGDGCPGCQLTDLRREAAPTEALSWLSAREASARQQGREEGRAEMRKPMACEHPAACEGLAGELGDQPGCGWCGDLADLRMVTGHLSRTYMHFSGGRISKPNTLPEEVFAIAADLATQEAEEDAADREAPAEKAEAPTPAPEHWLVSICREGVTEVTLFDAEDEARTFFAAASLQWSESFLSRVEIGPRDLGIVSKLRETSLACRWHEDENGAWDTQCGTIFEVSNLASLEENEMRYCHRCGKPIQTIPLGADDSEELPVAEKGGE